MNDGREAGLRWLGLGLALVMLGVTVPAEASGDLEARTLQTSRIVRAQLADARFAGRTETARCLDGTLTQLHAFLLQVRRPPASDAALRNRQAVLGSRLAELRRRARSCLGPVVPDGTTVEVILSPEVAALDR
ncbi:MAG: hypothetical protein AAGH15_02070 [Myxococcota bacterium]